jgi:hypothetical protein
MRLYIMKKVDYSIIECTALKTCSLPLLYLPISLQWWGYRDILMAYSVIILWFDLEYEEMPCRYSLLII